MYIISKLAGQEVATFGRSGTERLIEKMGPVKLQIVAF